MTIDKKKGKMLKDSVRIEEVINKNNCLFIKHVAHGDSYNAQSIKDGANQETYIYYIDKDITEVVILDGETENEPIKKDIYSRYSPEQQAEAEHEYMKYSKYIRSEGRICIPLRENARVEENIPPCSYMQKVGPMKFKAYMKGKYKGKEKLHTPVGDFECIKVHTENKLRIMLFSETEYETSWYAKGIGLIKSETTTSKGKVLSTTLLYAIKNNNFAHN